ncbi:MAG: aminopeptidase P family protein [Alphaproteobacteria bacterium]|nr:MAG: aminopeptidase P family protein [Alphaproteobacteria bacterium]
MFQDFTSTANPADGPPRLARLRDELSRAGLDGFLVPRADAHQGEYVAPCDERLRWLTGFTGSAGFAIATTDRAAIFVDGRYRLQVREQVDTTVFEPQDWPETSAADWLAGALSSGGRVGLDPWLHTPAEVERLAERLKPAGIELVETENLVDRIWTDRPAPPAAPVFAYPEELAGKTGAEKRAEIAAALARAGAQAAVLTLPDSIAWLLNIRGGDLPRVPVALAFAIIHADGSADLFINPRKVGPHTRAHLGPDVTIRPEGDFETALSALKGRVLLDPATAPLAVLRRLADAGAEVLRAPDPCLLPKARKTEAELAATTEAHVRDGAAMVEFLAWLDAHAPSGKLTEIDVVAALEGFRRDTGQLRDISFDTIAGAGPNGAIVHYRVTHETNRRVEPGTLLLVDSGGQYLDGTTDITRTIAVGPLPAGAAEAFTRVLKGMIAISRLRFPPGLAGRDIDAIARVALWEAGLDYDHGTGHGVGVFLSVHEGPQRISRKGETVLEPGMILSNEPGCYREGEWGIRIENLVVVEPARDTGARQMLGFRTLTLAPIDRRLVVLDLLSEAERAWLDAYHATVRDTLWPRVGRDARKWLREVTRPL